MIRKLIKSNERFIKHNLFSYAVVIFNLVSSLYAVRENILLLHKELYGLWILVFNASSILGMFHFGFSTVAIFKFNEYKDSNRMPTFFTNNLLVVVLQLLITAVLFVSVYLCSHLLINNTMYVPVFEKLLLWTLPGIIFTVVSSYLEAVLYYNLKYIYHRNFLELIRLGIMNLLFVLFLSFQNDVLVLAIVYSFVSMVAFGYTLIKFLKIQKITLKSNTLEMAYLKRNARDGFSFWVLGISSFVIAQTDTFFISILNKDIGLVSVYSQSFRLQDIALKFIKKITEIKGPKIFSLYAGGNHLAVVDVYIKLLKINILLSIIAFLGISFLGKFAFEFWLSKTIVFDQTLIVVLSLICITGSTHWVLWNFCNLTGQQNKVRNVVILEILLNFFLSYLLMKNIGLIGLGLASIISNSITIVFIFRLFLRFKNNLK